MFSKALEFSIRTVQSLAVLSRADQGQRGKRESAASIPSRGDALRCCQAEGTVPSGGSALQRNMHSTFQGQLPPQSLPHRETRETRATIKPKPQLLADLPFQQLSLLLQTWDILHEFHSSVTGVILGAPWAEAPIWLVALSPQ